MRAGSFFEVGHTNVFATARKQTCSIAAAVILSVAKDLSTLAAEILRCIQDDSQGIGQVNAAQILTRGVGGGVMCIRQRTDKESGSHRPSEGRLIPNSRPATINVRRREQSANDASLPAVRDLPSAVRVKLTLPVLPTDPLVTS